MSAKNATKFAQNLLLGILFLALLGLGTRLFFEDELSGALNSLQSQKPAESADKNTANSNISIGYAFSPQSLEPTLFNPVTRSRLVDIYEGLVRTDRNLKIEPALALSWGLIDPKTWELKLRPDVKFHSGRRLEMQDVIASIKRAQTWQNSQLKNLLSTIDSLHAVSAQKLRIITKNSDPLLINKLAVVFIFPREIADFENPVGTGPYRFIAKNGNEITLAAFQNYWGRRPYFKQVTLKTIPDKNDRISALEKGGIDLLADVPPSSAKPLSSENFLIKTVPSLETNFLVFNTQNSLLKDPSLRLAIAKSLNRQTFVDLADGYAHPVSQFVSNGIFGFNPELKNQLFDQGAATKLLPQNSKTFERLALTLDYPQGLEVLGQYIQAQLRALGIDLKLNPLPTADLQQKIKDRKSDFYYLGWKSELGDSDDFLKNVVHSRDEKGLYGEFNGSNFQNRNIDELIEKSEQDLNPKTRLKNLQNIMKVIVQDYVIGVPLFESDTIFAGNKNLNFDPRIDGYILASEINR